MTEFERIETFAEYERLAEKTCAYPEEMLPVCVTLGLCGEVGEMFEKMQSADPQESNDEEVLKEMGDVLWYLAMIHKKLGLPEVGDWMEITELTTECIFDPIVSGGKIAEQVKKYLRDEWNKELPIVIPEKRKETIFEEWTKILLAITYLGAKVTGTSIKIIAAMNLNKLYSRMERNQIHGEGDNR